MMQPQTSSKRDTYLPYYDEYGIDGEITLEEFVKLSQKRLGLLKKLDAFDVEMGAKDKYNQIIRDLREAKMHGFDNKPERLQDALSHYFLRLAYCRNKDLRDWFVRQECLIFRARLNEIKTSFTQITSIRNFIETELTKLKSRYGAKLCPFEKTNLAEERGQPKSTSKLSKAHRNYLEDREISLQDLVKVPFELVPRLVSNQSVLLIEGDAYLPMENADILIENFFKRHLEEVTKRTKSLLPDIEDANDVLAEYLEKIDNLFLCGKDYSKMSLDKQKKFNLADIDIFAHQHYPLCMRELHRHVKQNHHLRHTGRLQYTLFLKGIGLSMDDTIRFFRTEFTKRMPVDKFDKNYIYNIKHSFGKEGKRADYTPWSCSRIIQEPSPSKEEFHGCPFKEYSENNLKRLLMEFNLNSYQLDEILGKARGKHHQVACRTFYMATHPKAQNGDDVGVHPNGYLEASIAAGLAGEKGNDRSRNNTGSVGKMSLNKGGNMIQN